MEKLNFNSSTQATLKKYRRITQRPRHYWNPTQLFPHDFTFSRFHFHSVFCFIMGGGLHDLMLVKLGHWGDSAIDDELAQSVVQLNDSNSYELQDLDSLQEVLGGTADALLVDAGLAVPTNSPSYQYLLVELVKVVKRLQ
ncbi:MAG: hypothetical protein IE914_09930, partial [Thiotrichales bacterium]|nr:hypothetical protein [Thiotrichales bacterium]